MQTSPVTGTWPINTSAYKHKNKYVISCTVCATKKQSISKEDTKLHISSWQGETNIILMMYFKLMGRDRAERTLTDYIVCLNWHNLFLPLFGGVFLQA